MFSGCTVSSQRKETKLGSSNQQASPSATKNTGVVPHLCMEVHPYSYFRWCGYFWGLCVSFVMTDEFSVTVTKITSSIDVSWSHSLPLYFQPILTQWIMVILSKGYKPGNFESHSSLKLSFTNIWSLRLNFVDCESFLESNSPEIYALCQTNLDDSLILAISLWEVIFL